MAHVLSLKKKKKKRNWDVIFLPHNFLGTWRNRRIIWHANSQQSINAGCWKKSSPYAYLAQEQSLAVMPNIIQITPSIYCYSSLPQPNTCVACLIDQALLQVSGEEKQGGRTWQTCALRPQQLPMVTQKSQELNNPSQLDEGTDNPGSQGLEVLGWKETAVGQNGLA